MVLLKFKKKNPKKYMKINSNIKKKKKKNIILNKIKELI